MSTASPEHEHVDAHTGTSTTGHEWDGIRELNTPLPKWWLNIFYACIIWSFGYWIIYPAIPMATSFTKGVIGYSSRGEVTQELADLQSARAPMVKALSGASFADIEKDPKLLTSRVRRARRRSATIARHATARAAAARKPSRISSTTTGCGRTARWRTSSGRSRTASAQRTRRRAPDRCRPSARAC